MTHRRTFLRLGALALGNVFALALAVPGVKYLLDPLGKKSGSDALEPLARLDQLKVGEPQSFAIIGERRDGWIKYPREPVGSVWLVRQPDGSKDPVLAFNAECPHLGCPVNLAGDGKSFLCPCHQAQFGLDGIKQNQVPPRGLDSLECSVKDGQILVRFERFQTQTAEKKPRA